MRTLWLGTALFLLFSTAFLHAQDPHYTCARTGAAVRQSTFLHGYLHGYEEGFSTADLDLQMAREPRDPSKIKEARSASGYRSEFGPRRHFEAGYQQGFRVGYADSIAGRAFRAIDLIQQVMNLPVNPVAATDPPLQAAAPPEPRVPHASALLDEVTAPRAHEAKPASSRGQAGASAKTFDEAFADGYSSGQRHGVTDARSAQPPAASSPTCPPGLSQGSPGWEFCTAYVRGFAMGYSDGYVNVARPATTAAAAQSK